MFDPTTVLVNSFLPMLPFLTKLADGAITKAGEDAWSKSKGVSEDAWNKSKKICAILLPSINNHPKLKSAVSNAIENPTNISSQENVRTEFLNLLNENKKLADKLTELLDEKSEVDEKFHIQNINTTDSGKNILIGRDFNGDITM
jgi:hypothetical protein